MKPNYVIFTNLWAVPHYYCISSPAGKYEAVSDASMREVWNEFYTENNIISARLPANLFPMRLKFSRRWRDASPEALTMKACSKARFSRVVLVNILHNLCSFNSQVRGFNHVRPLKITFVINAFLSFCWAMLCRYPVIRNSNSVLSQGWWLAETKSTELCVQLILCFAAEGESLWNIIIYLSVGVSKFYLPSPRWIIANCSLYLILPFPTRSSRSPLFVW